MVAQRKLGVRDGQTLSLRSKRLTRVNSEHEDEEAYVHVRDRILSPALEKRVFLNDAEVGGYFNLGSWQSSVVDKLLAQGFANRVNGGLELCRFDIGTRARAISFRAHLDTLSFRLALPRLTESELVRIEAAALAFSHGSRFAEVHDEMWVIMSTLHEVSGRPLLSALTQDLHRQLRPYAYLDRDRVIFENLISFISRLPTLLKAGRLETLCSDLTSTYLQNAQVVSPQLAEFRRFHREVPQGARVARAVTFEAAA